MMEIVGGIGAIIAIIDSVTTLAKRLTEVKEKYDNVALYISLACMQLSSMRSALEAIRDWRSNASDTSDLSMQLHEDLDISLKCCAILIDVINAKLGEAGYTVGLKQKIRYLWLEDTLREYISNLEGQVGALSLLLNIFQCRTAAEQSRRLELTENRAIIKRVCDETSSLSLQTGDSQYSVSVFSLHPLDVDSILRRSRPYVNANGRARRRYSKHTLLDSSASSKHNDSHAELPIPELKTRSEGNIEYSPTTASVQAWQGSFGENQELRHAGDDQKFSLKSMDAVKIPSSRLFDDVDDLHQAARPLAVVQGLNNSPDEPSSSKPWNVIASDTNCTSSCNLCLSATSDQPYNLFISSSYHDDHYAPGKSASTSLTPERSSIKSQFLDVKRGDNNDNRRGRDLIAPDKGDVGSRSPVTHSCCDSKIIFESSKNLTEWPELVQSDAPVNLSNQESARSEIGAFAHCKDPPGELVSDITASATNTTTIFSQGSHFSSSLGQTSLCGLQKDDGSSSSSSNEISASTQAQLSETLGPQFSINAVDLRHRPSCSNAGNNAANSHLPSTQATDSKNVIQKLKRRNVGKLPLVGPLLCREKSFDSSALFESVKSGNTTTLERLLDTARINVNTRNESSKTLQMQAAVHGQLDCLHISRCRGADESAVGLKRRTVLHLAVEAKQIDAVSWLLRTYASPPEDSNHKSSRFLRESGLGSRERLFKGFLNASDKEGFKPLHIAAQVNFDKVVRLLVEAGSNVNARDKRDCTPLHEAILSNSYTAASALLSNGAHVNAVTLDQMSSLHLAAYSGNHELVPLLINKGASKLSYDSGGSMPIHQAAWHGHLKAIQGFVGERTDLTLKTRFGGTLLHIAVFWNNIDLAQYLLQHNVDVNPWATFPQTHLSAAIQYEMQSREMSTSWLAKLESTPLHYSCYFGDIRLTSLLLKHGALPNAPIEKGMTPLMMAVDAENLDLVCLLLSYGARVNASVPVSCLTALHLASARGNEPIVQKLVERGATINAILYAQGAALLTPLEYAIKVLIAKPENFAKLTAIIRCFVQIDGTQLERAKRFVRLRPPNIKFSVTLSNYLNSQHLRDTAAASRNQSFVTEHKQPYFTAYQELQSLYALHHRYSACLRVCHWLVFHGKDPGTPLFLRRTPLTSYRATNTRVPEAKAGIPPLDIYLD